jgi:hypothetical protein
MKRIAAPRALGGPSCGGPEVKVPSGISCPASGRWTPSPIPQTWIGDSIQDGGQIWPDCCD